jgi:hypothetical protein
VYESMFEYLELEERLVVRLFLCHSFVFAALYSAHAHLTIHMQLYTLHTTASGC